MTGDKQSPILMLTNNNTKVRTMKRYEFVAETSEGVLKIPKKYLKGIKSQEEVRVIVLTNEKTNDPLFKAISLSTKDWNFDRDEANKR